MSTPTQTTKYNVIIKQWFYQIRQVEAKDHDAAMLKIAKGEGVCLEAGEGERKYRLLGTGSSYSYHEDEARFY